MASKEKEGIFVTLFIILGLIAFIILFFGLRGGLKTNRNYYNVAFPHVSGLQVDDPVYILGVEKGNIKKIRIVNNRVLVMIAVDSDVPVPKNSEISLKIRSYLTGELYLTINLGTGPIATTRDTMLGKNEVLDIESMITTLTAKLEKLDFDAIGNQLGKQGERLVTEVRKGLQESFTPLFASFDKIVAMTEKVDSLFNMIGKTDGTISKLVTSDELYQEVIATNQELRTLLKDIKENPKRYFTIKIF